MSTLDSVADLRSIYRPPGRGPVDKVIHALDQHCVDFLARSPFFVLSTANTEGTCDGSPKGGPPGFVEAIDPQHVAWADYSGNNRLDSFQNIVTNRSVALLFFLPGLDETLRINGTATLSTDPDLCARFTVGDRAARVVVVVTVEEAYVHCAKALRRAELWSPEAWPDGSELPSAASIVRDHVGLDTDIETIEAHRRQDMEATLWRPGGEQG